MNTEPEKLLRSDHIIHKYEQFLKEHELETVEDVSVKLINDELSNSNLEVGSSAYYQTIYEIWAGVQKYAGNLNDVLAPGTVAIKKDMNQTVTIGDYNADTKLYSCVFFEKFDSASLDEVKSIYIAHADLIVVR